jgi:hypothetical protein
MGKGKRADRIAGMIACTLLALPAVAWAGSSQASLAVSAVVPARCAVRVLPSAEPGVGARDSVVMKCTKGSLPSGDQATASRASAVEPRITRDLVFAVAPAPAAAPRPLSEQAPADGPTSRLVVTVNF